MGDQFGILLALLFLAYLFIAPIALMVSYSKHNKKIRWLEDELLSLKQSFHDYREQMARRLPPETSPVKDQSEGERDEMKAMTIPMAEPVSSALDAGSREPASIPAKEMEPVPQPEEKPVIAPSMGIDEDAETVDHSEKIRTFLQGIGMWPPSRQEGVDRETVLMQWWLPRAGGVLALLSALFFGVYINQNTSPLFKCIELLAVSFGVTGLGWFMERKYSRFGGVLLVTGLIMVYLTSVAAYMLPATRIITSPVTGSVVQGAVLALICGVAVMRHSRGLLLLVFHFGYFLGLFMVYEGLREGALIEAGLLFIAGMALVRRESFHPLAWVLVTGSYLVVLAYPILSVIEVLDLPGSYSVQVYIGLIFAGIISAYYTGILGKDRNSHLLLSLGSSLAIISTLLFFRGLYPEDLEWSCLSLGIVMLAGSLIGWVRSGCKFAVQLLFIKASFLIGVWAILYYAGDLRWMVLALQTMVVATAARRARVVAMEVLVWAVALVSLVYFVDAISESLLKGTFVWWMMVTYPMVIMLSLGLLMKTFEGIPFVKGKFHRAYVYAFIPLLATSLWNGLFENTLPRDFDMALPFIGLVYIAGGLSRIRLISGWMLLELAGLVFVTGSIHFCDEPFSIIQLAGLLVAAAIALYFITLRTEKWALATESALYLLSIVPITLWTLQLMDNWTGQAVVVFILCAITVLGGMAPFVRQVGSWAFIPLLVFMVTEDPAEGAGFLNIAALAAGLGWLVLPAALPRIKSGMGWASNKDAWVIIGGVFYWLYAITFGDPEATWMAGQWVLGTLAILLLLACERWKLHGFLIASLLFAMTVMLRHTIGMGQSLWNSDILMSAGLLYAFALLWFFLKPNPFRKLPEPTPKLIDVMSSGASAILLFAVSLVTFQSRDLGWLDWYTPILAVTAFILILLGLFFRDTIYRRLGLIVLLVPLARLFLVDVQDVLHRIIAFAASAVLLTLLGYLYHRLSSRLSNEKPSS